MFEDNMNRNEEMQVGRVESTYYDRDMSEEFEVEVQNEEPNFNWNFGGFALSFYFAFGTGVWTALVPTILMAFAWIPFVGGLLSIISLICSIITGKKGAVWAWNTGRFETVKEFNAVMRTWNRAGIAAFVCQCVVGIAIIGFVVFALLFADSVIDAMY